MNESSAVQLMSRVMLCRYFNPVQSETFPIAYGTEANMVSHKIKLSTTLDFSA